MSIHQTDLAVYSIENKTIDGAAILSELRKLQSLDPGRNRYVVFKPARGVWVVAELLDQHVSDHGDVPVEEKGFGGSE